MFTLQEQESTVIKTNLVHPRGRDTFWRFYFGTVPDWQRIEGDIFNMMAKCCQTYQGAFWEFSMLSNGGAFIWPDMLEPSLQMFNPHNGNEAELSPEATGIAVCLMVYSIWSFKTESSVLIEYFYQLRDYAMQHPEQAQIFHLID
ncbi:TPA: antirestriction protein [Proteus mirabilis]|uniref:antirestriction protein n=2 Tax=Proteus mirabilis TaxID=584 RepID=UPI000D570B45|nr:antirestriction protein [Proteus mirabilis]EIT1738076.1 antirestriction protein [Proteus mirabilis]EJG2211559.1 antirestriction protein [Proteus mirabilis]EKX2216219.1 antirestriction protein [Proteus mirabilis]EKX4939814.1 antirestriction protein [Proteus mirabilis]EKX6492761.1 antirestriction protein [Proteus mirabilis]